MELAYPLADHIRVASRSGRDLRDTGANQSILVSGESGAGKVRGATVTELGRIVVKGLQPLKMASYLSRLPEG
jgi:hypothetical protein